MADLRNPTAKARDAFFQTNEGAEACDPSTLGNQKQNPSYYLRNRLESAFLAGYAAGEKAKKQTGVKPRKTRNTRN